MGHPHRSRPLILVCGWWALLAVANLRWVESHILALPPPWDPAHYQSVALRVFHALLDSGWLAAWREMHALTPVSPPFFPLSTVPLYGLLGETRAVAHFTSSVYLGLHLLGTYLLGRRQHGVAGGLLSAGLLSTFSAVINLSRDYHYDFPAAAFVTLAVACLLASDGFTRLGPATGFGIFLGLATLTKSMAAPFLLGPLCCELWSGLRGGARIRPAAAATAIATAIAVALPWWGFHLGDALRYLWYYGLAEGAAPYAEAGTEPMSVRNLLHYALALINHGASVPHFALALVVAAGAMSGAAEKQGSQASRGPLWAWLLTGYALLTISINKSGDRYVVFLVTPVAVLLAGSILRLRPGRWRRTALAGAAVAGAINYAAWTFEGRWTPPVTVYHPLLHFVTERPRQQWLRVPYRVPDGEWPLAEVVQRIGARGSVFKTRSRERYLSARAERSRPEELVRSAYLGLLGRPPDSAGGQIYASRLRAGEPVTSVLMDIAHSEEFEDRSVRVLVVLDHVFVNAATLDYYAAAARARIRFIPLSEAAEGTVLEAGVSAGGDRPLNDPEQRFLGPAHFEREVLQPCRSGTCLWLFAPAP